MGLKRLPNSSLMVSFYNINYEISEIEHSVIITIDEKNQYQPVSSNPLIPDFQQHINNFNQSNDFAKFVCGVRNSFKNLY